MSLSILRFTWVAESTIEKLDVAKISLMFFLQHKICCFLVANLVPVGIFQNYPHLKFIFSLGTLKKNRLQIQCPNTFHFREVLTFMIGFFLSSTRHSTLSRQTGLMDVMFWQINQIPLLNGPFPSCCLSRFRSESWCSTIVREMSLIWITIRNSFPFEWLCTRTRFETEACSNSEMGYSKNCLSVFIYFCINIKFCFAWSRLTNLYLAQVPCWWHKSYILSGLSSRYQPHLTGPDCYVLLLWIAVLVMVYYSRKK